MPVALLIAQALPMPDVFVTMLERGGLVVALFLFGYGFVKGWWVPGSMYQKKEQECAEYREVLVRQSGLVESAFKLLDRHGLGA